MIGTLIEEYGYNEASAEEILTMHQTICGETHKNEYILKKLLIGLLRNKTSLLVTSQERRVCIRKKSLISDLVLNI